LAPESVRMPEGISLLSQLIRGCLFRWGPLPAGRADSLAQPCTAPVGTGAPTLAVHGRARRPVHARRQAPAWRPAQSIPSRMVGSALPTGPLRMKASTLRLGMNLWPPYLVCGIHVTRLSDDWRQARVELRLRPWNRNYVGTHFGCSLFAMSDPFWMLLLMHRLGSDYYVWDQAAEITFVKPGRGTVWTTFEVDDAIVARIRAATAAGDKHLQ